MIAIHVMTIMMIIGCRHHLTLTSVVSFVVHALVSRL